MTTGEAVVGGETAVDRSAGFLLVFSLLRVLGGVDGQVAFLGGVDGQVAFLGGGSMVGWARDRTTTLHCSFRRENAQLECRLLFDAAIHHIWPQLQTCKSSTRQPAGPSYVLFCK